MARAIVWFVAICLGILAEVGAFGIADVGGWGALVLMLAGCAAGGIVFASVMTAMEAAFPALRHRPPSIRHP